MTTNLLTGLALTLAALSSGSPPRPCAAPIPQDPRAASDFPIPSDPLMIPVQVEGRPTRIADLCALYGAATGQVFLHSEETRAFLEQQTVGLAEPLTVPAERVQFVFETFLIENDFALVTVCEEAPRILSVVSLNTGARTSLRDWARVVAADDVDVMRGHPAMIFTTLVNLPNTDVRQLANSMRTMVTDANTQQMLPAGNTNCVLVTGFGPQLVGLVQALRMIDEASSQDVMKVETEGEK